MPNVHAFKKTNTLVLSPGDPVANARALFKQDHRFWDLSFNDRREVFSHYGWGKDRHGSEIRPEVVVSVGDIRAWLWHFLDGAQKLNEHGRAVRYAPRSGDVDELLDVVLSICRSRNLKWGVDA